MNKAIVLAAAIALNAGAALGDDKPPQTITIDNCAKVEISVRKVDRPNGTVWLQSVTCTGDAAAPEVRKVTSVGIPVWTGGTACISGNGDLSPCR